MHIRYFVHRALIVVTIPAILTGMGLLITGYGGAFIVNRGIQQIHSSTISHVGESQSMIRFLSPLGQTKQNRESFISELCGMSVSELLDMRLELRAKLDDLELKEELLSREVYCQQLGGYGVMLLGILALMWLSLAYVNT